MEKATFKISGMSCKSCAKIIELELADEKGIASAAVNFSDLGHFWNLIQKKSPPWL